MQFLKKVLVLKQTETGYSLSSRPLTGIIRIEIDNGVADLYLSLINFAPATSGNFFCFIVDGKKKTYSFDLGKRPSSLMTSFIDLPDITHGFAVGVCLVQNDLPLTVAFSKSDEFVFTITDFKKIVADKCLENRRLEKRKAEEFPKSEPQPTKSQPDEIEFPSPSPVKPPYPPSENPDPEKTPPDEFLLNEEVKKLYDDEAVATENYFDFDQSINDKLNAIRGWNDERIRLEDELPFARNQTEEEKSKQNDYRAQDETDLKKFQGDQEREPYYNSVREELNSIFANFPEDEELEKTFPNSRFSRVSYSENKFYVVGVIKEQNQEKYICYGVPAVYSKEPPKELKGFCSFIPLSIFDMKGDGYWMMFQDAVTGECIKR